MHGAEAITKTMQRDFDDLALGAPGTLRGEHACGEETVAQVVSGPATGVACAADKVLDKWCLPEMRTCVLGDELGKGSTGVVVRASLGDGGAPVAVKVLRRAAKTRWRRCSCAWWTNLKPTHV